METKKLDTWIRNQVFIEDEERGRCKKILVRHVANGKIGSEVLSVTVPKKGCDESWISETVVAIQTQIHDDAEGLGGVQTYNCHAFYENRPDKPGPRFTIREMAGEGEDNEGVESEPPTKTGLLSQLMRHNEAFARTLAVGFAQITNTQRHMIGRLAEHNEKLVEERAESFRLIEGLRSEDMERKVAMQREDLRNKMVQDGFDKVSTLLPLVVNRLAGKKLLPEKRTSVESMVQSFLESVTPEQLQTLQASLRPEQMAVLMEVFTSLRGPESETKGNGKCPNEGEG